MKNLFAYYAMPVLVGVLASTTGCAQSPFSGAAHGYDEQGCVEHALRHNPDKESLEGAHALFDQACRIGDGGACSALGVIFELGRGVERDPQQAVALYRRACKEGNARGCTNLGLALEHGLNGAPAPKEARDQYARACDAQERSGCANLGRLYKEGHVVPKNLDFAKGLLQNACTAGETSACLDLADVIESDAPDAAFALYVKGCVAGDPAACARVERNKAKNVAAVVTQDPVAAK